MAKHSSRYRGLRIPLSVDTLESRIMLSLPTLWTSVGPGGGGAFFSPSFSPTNPNEIYVASDVTNVFHTTNLAASWSVIPFQTLTGSTTSSIQFTNNPNILYVIDNNSIPLKSADGGKTWTELPNDPTADNGAFFLYADFNNPNRLFVSDYNNVYFTSDGGSTWSTAYTNDNDAYVAGDFFDGNNIYLATDKGLITSTDNGVTFSATPAAPGIDLVNLSIYSFAGSKSGSTTRFVVATAAAGDVFPGAEGNVYQSYGGIYSMDVGQSSWSLKTTGINANDDPVFVAMSQNDINDIYIAGGSSASPDYPTVYKSTNGGNNWSPIFLTTNNQNIQTGWQGDGGNRHWDYGEFALGLAVSPVDPTKVMVTDLGAAYLTTNAGTLWKAAYVNPASLNPAGSPTPTGLSYLGNGMEDTSAWWLTFSDANDFFGSWTDIKAARTTNAGTSWSFNFTGDTFNSMYQTIIQPSTGTLFAATSSVHDIYQWSRYFGDGQINSGTGAILYSTNKGAAWTTLHNFGHPVVWTALDPTNPNRMYAAVVNHTGGVGGIYVSNNINLLGSSTWTLLTAPPRTEGHPYNINVLNDGTLVVTYAGRTNASGVFTSSSGVFVATAINTDGHGLTTWIDRTDPAMELFTRDLTIDPTDPTQNTWYAGVWFRPGQNSGGLYKTINRGVSWTLVPGSTALDQITQLAINPNSTNEAYITTADNGLWYTANIHVANPVFTQVTAYPFMVPTRVFFNPFNPNQVWVTSYGNGIEVGTTPPAPTVIAVHVDSTAWSAGFLTYLASTGLGDSTLGYTIPTGSSAQLNSLPWPNLNQISITFNEDVTATQTALTLTGLSTTYAFSSFSYSSANHTATWTVNQNLPADKLLLNLNTTITDAAGHNLDGEWTDSVSTQSGNGSPGGNFQFHLNILPADINHDNIVDGADFDIWFTHLQTHTYNWTLGDINADGLVDGADFDIWFSHLQQSLPASPINSPALLAATTTTTQSPPSATARATVLSSTPTTLPLPKPPQLQLTNYQLLPHWRFNPQLAPHHPLELIL